MSCTASLEGPVDFDSGGAVSFPPGHSALPGGLQPAGPEWAKCLSGGRTAWPCLAEGTVYTDSRLARVWQVFRVGAQGPGTGLGLRKAFLSAEGSASRPVAPLSGTASCPACGSSWLAVRFRTARGFVLVFPVLGMKIRMTVCRTTRDSFALPRNTFIVMRADAEEVGCS